MRIQKRSVIATRAIGGVCLLLGSVCPSGAAPKASPPFVIGVHDSFLGGSKGQAELKRRLEAFWPEPRPEVVIQVLGDAGQIPARLGLEARGGLSHLPNVVVGLDGFSSTRLAKWIAPWKGWTPSGWKERDAKAELPAGVLPYDFGVLAFIVNREELARRGLPVPRHYRDLLTEPFRKQFIVQDPRSSSVGMGFTWAWSHWGGGDWKALARQWLVLAPGWDVAYGLFLKNEAPLVWSYTTSEAYHREEGKSQYSAVLFEEGHPVQVEGAAILVGHPEQEPAGRAFLEFLFSRDTQSWIARKQWMFPARRTADAPQSFAKLPQPKKWAPAPREGEGERVLDQWKAAVE